MTETKSNAITARVRGICDMNVPVPLTQKVHIKSTVTEHSLKIKGKRIDYPALSSCNQFPR